MKYSWVATSRKLRDETGFEFDHDTRSAFADFAKYVLNRG
jgi:hypothetical protein